MDLNALLSGNTMSIIIFLAIAYILYKWIGGGMKQPIWKIFTIVPLPDESRSEVHKTLKDEIETMGKPTKAALVYDGWKIGDVKMVLKKKVAKEKKKKKSVIEEIQGEDVDKTSKSVSVGTVYAFLVSVPSGWTNKDVIVYASDRNVMVGDKVFILKNAPVPIGKDIYMVDSMGGTAVTMSSVSMLMGDLVAAMRMALPEMYVWANPATAAVIKEFQEQATLEREEFESKVKSIT